MKFIKSYQIFESNNLELEKELARLGIYNYILNDDGSIDVNQNIDFSSSTFNIIPFNFNKVNGNFIIQDCNIKSLKYCAKYIVGEFYCNHNQLKSLEFGPEYVGSKYNCVNNKLLTLEGCVEEVYGIFNCSNNKLTSLEFCPMQVYGYFNCSDNKLEYLDRSPFIKGNLICKGMFKTEPEFNGSCEKLIWR